ncbi:hypothetical protein [Deinococcus sp. S9]|uniref:hypothetical protein n=1 Tax=Deinococcus sp. S9 TaxID=2545754 RepID=UPI0010551BC3|nr:hypothetical protein [Deinococcus sp. S9]TDE85743.1 hypothetical protein E0686_09815 [Deinococcus sp. S9]
MSQEMLNVLALPLLFSVLGGSYAYLRFPDRRPNVLLTLILFQLVGGYGYSTQPSSALFSLLALHGLVVLTLLLHGLQSSQLELLPERTKRD